MSDNQTTAVGNPAGGPDNRTLTPPAISLPKGGGAIHGIGEKFSVSPVTGTGALRIPIATSPGRSGFGPQLSLAYDSGAGNSPFGFGWRLALPEITRKTDRGLPRYNDAEESDLFILSGAEDLMPVLSAQNDQWLPEQLPLRAVNGTRYHIQRYRPRIEGLFARIERWTHQDDPSDVFWRSIAQDNTTSWYGKTADSRIVDPSDPLRIFSWLLCESYDDQGNVIAYGYKRENAENVDRGQLHERNRERTANCYLKWIRYGNRVPYFPRFEENQPWPALPGADSWCFEVVCDYGEHAAANPQPNDAGAWAVRNDPFSSYRAGFELRTYRLCQRVLMFHHFPNEAGVGADCLVRSTDFTYAYEQDPTAGWNPIFSALRSATQTSYQRQDAGGYLARSRPPLEFSYSQVPDAAQLARQPVAAVDEASLGQLPQGLDGSAYQWVDLDGEGVTGILTEQGGAWWYKRNLSPLAVAGDPGSAARFAAAEPIASQPNLALTPGWAQLIDLAGDGQIDLVALTSPLAGFYEHDQGTGWAAFQPFSAQPGFNPHDPNLRFIDLDGDGHADVLITDHEALRWHPSLGEAGFGPALRVPNAPDEERGPTLVFADSTQSIYLADMSGDGLTDLVRIRNGEVCYWPNCGYGRFGAKVAMDNAPWFATPDQFNQQQIVLADIDGSGVTDIMYLGQGGAQIYFNQSGNSWSKPVPLPQLPLADRVGSVHALDLLGSGTACLVWSSPLPGDARQPMRYIDLMGGQKPHLLVQIKNNLGAETLIQYAPSTRFYLQDQRSGQPWVTKLPFPVHCVEKVIVTDKWRQTAFSSSYAYHHGYFDGAEREFRGFGCIEQVDVESYGQFAQGNTASPYITADKTLYQPPVKTITWYHTGALFDVERMLGQFEHDYFPRWFEALRPPEAHGLGGFQEKALPQPDLASEGWSADEWREAARACKGMLLRQEVYELDVDALEHGEHRPVRLFSAADHTGHIRRLQPQAHNRHAVFLPLESESIVYHYELDLRPDTLRPDPRITHTLNLQVDGHGNILQSVSVVYPRLGQFEDSSLPPDALALIRRVQQETHVGYTETRYTNDVLLDDTHRLRVPCEVLTYELTGISPEDADDLDTADPRDNRYFTLDELRRLQLSPVYQPEAGLIPVAELPYHQLPSGNSPEKRLVEHTRMLFFNAELPTLSQPLPFGQLGRLGLAYESYTLALTDDLLNRIFSDAAGNKLDTVVQGPLNARDLLKDAGLSGYLSGAELAARFAPAPAAELAGQYWIRSGIAGFAPDAAQHFYVPERYTDPFGNVTTLEYDGSYDLYLKSSTDALDNTTRITRFDFRVLAPQEMEDLNGNLSEICFDVLGRPTALALKGKGAEGDNLSGFATGLANPEPAEIAAFFTAPGYAEAPARHWLGNATARQIYSFGEIQNADGSIGWAAHPACACGIMREQHLSQLAPGEQSALQAAVEYSDGLGSVVVKKVQAEPAAAGQPLRWVASGKTILNNKGKPVKQYEPYFSPPEVAHRFEEPREEGVTPIIFYDAVGRSIRTDLPDGSYTRVEFSPWQLSSYDSNDTLLEAGNRWLANKTAASASAEERRAAELSAAHANTPTLIILDSLGREVISIGHNRVRESAGALTDQKSLTFTRLDAEGKPLWVRDARNNLVVQAIMPPVANNQASDPTSGFVPCYDIAGNQLFHHSMDAGKRWILNDAAGQPLLAWDERGHRFRTEYDVLHRPVASFVTGTDPVDPRREIQFEQMIYGDTPSNGLSESQRRGLNLRGRPYRHQSSAGLTINQGRSPVSGADEAYDFKGNLLRSTHQLASNYKQIPDWSQNPALESERYSGSARYDALNRPIQTIAPHSDQPAAKLTITRPGYNQAGLLERVDVWLEQASEPATLLDVTTATRQIVANIDYNAKGQRLLIEYSQSSGKVITTYRYDRETFRLSQLVTTRPNHPEADQRILQDLTYTYDPSGNITHIRDKAQERVFHSNACVEPGAEYRYDALYRLVAASGREHIGGEQQPNWDDSRRVASIPNDCRALRNYVETYRYDEVGNILQMLHHQGRDLDQPGLVLWNRRYQYALDSNRLLATRLPGDPDNLPEYSAAPGYSEQYGYDQHGNLLAMPHLPALEWNFKDQLRATQRQVVNNGAGEKTYYVYDSSGQRVRKVTETQTGARKDERIYLGGFEVYRAYGAAGLSLERETLHVMDDKQRVALIETRTYGADLAPRQLVRYQHTNQLGSATVEVDDQAQIVSYEEFYPYGASAYQAARSQTETPKRYRYTGKERDEETGLYYHGARYYAPWLGRWASCDPAGLADGPNVYEYVQGNPVRLRDPTGTYGVDDLNKDLGRLNRAVGVLNPAIGAAQAIGSAVGGKLTEAVVGKSAAQDGEPAQPLSVPQRAEAATDALIATTPFAPIHRGSKAAGQAIGQAITKKISKEEAVVNVAKTEPTGIVSKTFETAEALDRAEIASNSGKTGDAIRGYVDAGISIVELVEVGTALALGLRSGGGKLGGSEGKTTPSATPSPTVQAQGPLSASKPVPQTTSPAAGSTTGPATVEATSTQVPRTQPGVPRDPTHSGSMFHYTDVAPEKFAGGVQANVSFTVEGDLSTKQAIARLGLRRAPTIVVEVIDKGQFKLTSQRIVQPHPYGQGGAYDFYTPVRIPPEDIRGIHPMGRSGPMR